jgi:hypothetical protein
VIQPRLDEEQQAAFIKKIEEVAPRYNTEILREA